MDTRRHAVRIFTPISVIDGKLELPATNIRLSGWLGSRDSEVLIVHDASVIYVDGDVKDDAQVGVAATACLAVVDKEPPSQGEPSMRIQTRPMRIEVGYAPGLRIEGDLHLSLGAEYDNILASLSSGGSKRVLTNCVVRLGGVIASEGDTILTDLRTAVHILELPDTMVEIAPTPVIEQPQPLLVFRA